MRDIWEAGDKRCPSSLDRFIRMCSRCRPGVVVKYITALPDGHYQPVVITETCGGNAYIGKGDVGTVPAHKW